MSASLEPAETLRLEQASAWCLRLAEGGMTADEQARFEAWADADPLNRAALEDTVGVWRGLHDSRVSPEAIALRREALALFEGAARSRWSLRDARWFKPIVAVAACLVVAVTVGLSWRAFAPVTYATAVGERRVVVLDDGSKLSLDADSRVRVRYDGRHRRLWLDAGRAKFEVAKDPRRPFTVAAADKTVRATGTQFSVELLQKQVRVVLYEGRVVVLDDQGDKPRPVRTARGEALTPGRELVTPISAPTARVAAADPARSLSWEAGQLVFVDEPLASVIERVNRYSPDKLSVGDARAAAVRVDGVVAAGDTDAFLEGVTGVLPLRIVETAEGKSLVYHP